MQLTDRDKKLLLILFIILLVFFYYNFFWKGYIKEINNLENQKQYLQDNLNILNAEMSIYKREKNKISNYNIKELNTRLPPNQDQMFTILDLQNLAKQFNVEVSDYNISQKQYVRGSLATEFKNIFYFSSHQTWRITYEDLKKLFETQKYFYPLYSIDSVNLINSGDKVIVDFEIKFYGCEDKFATKRKLEFSNVNVGKSNLFK